MEWNQIGEKLAMVFKAAENEKAAAAAAAIHKGILEKMVPPKAVKATSKATGKLTKNAIFIQSVIDNPGITMAETCSFTGSVDKHYNLLKSLMAAGKMAYGPARNGKKNVQGLYWTA